MTRHDERSVHLICRLDIADHIPRGLIGKEEIQPVPVGHKVAEKKYRIDYTHDACDEHIVFQQHQHQHIDRAEALQRLKVRLQRRLKLLYVDLRAVPAQYIGRVVLRLLLLIAAEVPAAKARDNIIYICEHGDWV
jgi:hypothetical protein